MLTRSVGATELSLLICGSLLETYVEMRGRRMGGGFAAEQPGDVRGRRRGARRKNPTERDDDSGFELSLPTVPPPFPRRCGWRANPRDRPPPTKAPKRPTHEMRRRRRARQKARAPAAAVRLAHTSAPG